MTRSSIFRRLRELALTGQDIIHEVDDALIPIEQTIDGWFCLTAEGIVVHVQDTTREREAVALRLATALIGKLSRRVPLATCFMPPPESPTICEGCRGTGALLDSTGGERPSDVFTCECGGLGWLQSVQTDQQ